MTEEILMEELKSSLRGNLDEIMEFMVETIAINLYDILSDPESSYMDDIGNVYYSGQLRGLCGKLGLIDPSSGRVKEKARNLYEKFKESGFYEKRGLPITEDNNL